jgi:hypothetical protein
MAISVKYSDGTVKEFTRTSESNEAQIIMASYSDNYDEVQTIIKEEVALDLNASVWHSPTRGNGTALVLTGLKEIAKLLIDNGADVNFVYDTENHKITPLDSAYKEIEKESTKNNIEKQTQINNLISFLESVGAKKYSQIGDK